MATRVAYQLNQKKLEKLIQKQNQELEAKVLLRTAELQNINE